MLNNIWIKNNKYEDNIIEEEYNLIFNINDENNKNIKELFIYNIDNYKYIYY